MDFKAVAEATNNPHIVKQHTKGARVEKVIRIIRKDSVHIASSEHTSAQPNPESVHHASDLL
ncbi:hypothetical protein QKW35_05450 [Pontibacterium granulatum]|uniref:hypothetical protein n=1 Tax=Pontibacterium granulatum TaxID=2036029 RepID=UPI00249A16EC|nr:hypothetical protein [Pontibacterium granulatum]MDI3323817.1 hypothetical protein [Pontibacterium granulatum]